MATVGSIISFDETGQPVVDWVISAPNISPVRYPIDRAARVLTTKGDLLVKTATGFDRLPAGTNGQSLIADNSRPAGLKWGLTSTGPSGSGLFDYGLVSEADGVTPYDYGSVVDAESA